MSNVFVIKDEKSSREAERIAQGMGAFLLTKTRDSTIILNASVQLLIVLANALPLGGRAEILRYLAGEMGLSAIPPNAGESVTLQ